MLYPKSLIICGVVLAAGLVVRSAQAQSLRFYDTFSGANFQKWWQTVGIPACAGTTGGHVDYATPDVVGLLQRLKATANGGGDIDLLLLTSENIAQFGNAGLLEDLRKLSDKIPNMSRAEPPDSQTAAGYDLQGQGVPFARFQYGFAYNSNEIPSPPRSFKELYERRDEWKGKITYVDPRVPQVPTGRYFVAGFLRAFGSDLGMTGGTEDATWQNGWDKLKQFEKVGYAAHPLSSAPLFQLFSAGEIEISFVAVDYIAYARQIGVAPDYIKTIIPSDGSPGGAADFAIPRSASPEQKAKAASFINCALSNDVQVKMTSDTFEYPGTNVWSEIPARVFENVPDEKSFKTGRLLINDEISGYIQKVWARKVDY